MPRRGNSSPSSGRASPSRVLDAEHDFLLWISISSLFSSFFFPLCLPSHGHSPLNIIYPPSSLSCGFLYLFAPEAPFRPLSAFIIVFYKLWVFFVSHYYYYYYWPSVLRECQLQRLSG